MNIRTRIATTVALAAGLLALASPAGAATPQDANERAGAAVSVPGAVSGYTDANGRSAIGTGRGAGADSYLDAAGRAAAFAGVDEAPTGSSIVSGDGFDWSAAAIGASSGLVLALLLGGGLIFARRYRSGPIAH
jgi:hypothetical protein